MTYHQITVWLEDFEMLLCHLDKDWKAETRIVGEGKAKIEKELRKLITMLQHPIGASRELADKTDRKYSGVRL